MASKNPDKSKSKIKLPRTRMNIALKRALRRLNSMTLIERLNLMVEAKSITPEEGAEAIKRLSAANETAKEA